MSVFRDLTGMKFGRLTVLKRVENNKHGQACWLCKCSCGNEIVVVGGSLKSGLTQSCGCLQREFMRNINLSHGMSHTKIYKKWKGMMARCYNPKHKNFGDYGGRGIRVCERWHVFDNFYEDVSQMEHFGEKGYSLERENNDKDYCPENCHWASAKEQCRNRRSNITVEYNGKKMCLMEAAEKSGISYRCLYNRYHRDGKRGAELFKPARNYNKK